MPHFPTRADRRLELGLVGRHALLHELEEPELLDEGQLRAGSTRAMRVRLERARQHERPVLVSDEQERVDDRERDLVPQRGLADRVAVEQDRRHEPANRA